ncbi:MAG: hypothetical protein HGA45_12075, partial [Chloroflexales bacterium]|nr:hypothetical protein [Chloroflexales bacterium]
MRFNELASWIPQTKLTPPRLRGDLVPRPQLLQSLQQAVTSYALTLIAAPAGYGKTTLLVAYAQSSALMPVAWFALDEQDDDPSLFLTGLVAAMRRHYPACGQRAQATLAQPALSAQRVAGALINDLLTTIDRPTILVLDDLHLVRDPAIYALLTYLVEHIPPLLRLVIATRHDPPLAMARWRARGMLAELRLSELSFSDAEATSLLNSQLRLNLEADELAALQQSTEGWVAGLRLLAGSLEHLPSRADRTLLLQHLAQGNRAVAEVLVDEVLSGQEPEVRAFLLATSILDELTPALCEAVTGRQDAEAILDTLYRRNLFLIALHSASPAAPPSYRYHALFAGFLRQQLAHEMTPDEIIALHRVAAAAEPVAARAIQHYLAVGAWDDATRRIEQEGGLIVRRGLRRTLQGWIDALPPALAAARPRLSYLLGVCAWQQGQVEGAYALLQRAAAGFAALGDQAGQGEALIDMVIPLFWLGDLA